MMPDNTGQAGVSLLGFIALRPFRCLSGVLHASLENLQQICRAMPYEEARNASDQKLKSFLIEMADEWQRLAQQAAGTEGGRRSETSNFPSTRPRRLMPSVEHARTRANVDTASESERPRARAWLPRRAYVLPVK